MKKALLIGTSFSAAPIYFALKKRGLHVTVCGGVRTDPCHQYADSSIYIDYSNPQDLYEVIKNKDFDYIVPSCNDYSYLSASQVANKMGFPGYDSEETTAVLHTKKLFREKTAAFKLKAPKTFLNSNNIKRDLKFPCLVKPVDSFSGRGVIKIKEYDELHDAVQMAKESSRTGEIVIEEYVSGSLHSHSAFISNKKITIDFFVDEYCTNYPYQVNCSNYPSLIKDSIRLSVRLEMEKLAKELDIADGLLHTQFISNGDDFWIIECMRRCPGDLYGGLIERSTGVSYTDLFVKPFIGEDYEDEITKLHEYYCGRHTISTSVPIVNFSFTTKMKMDNLEIVQLKGCGERLEPAPFDKLAIIFTKFENSSEMSAKSPNFREFFQLNNLYTF